MIGRIVELTPDAPEPRHVGTTRGALTITTGTDPPEPLTLDLIDALILPQYGVTITTGALRKLAEHNIPVIICGTNYHPLAICQPLTGNHYAAQRLDHQIAATQPLKKQTWAHIVTTKIRNQSAVLNNINPNAAHQLHTLSGTVQSGDPANIEAQAARIYWPALLGPTFRRRPEQPDINCALNYGYAIIRAATARACVAAGLNPAIGIFHTSPTNSFRLVDDLMEPYRPLVDRLVATQDRLDRLDPASKKTLVGTLTTNVQIGTQDTSAATGMQLTAQSWVQRLTNPKQPLLLPTIHSWTTR